MDKITKKYLRNPKCNQTCSHSTKKQSSWPCPNVAFYMHYDSSQKPVTVNLYCRRHMKIIEKEKDIKKIYQRLDCKKIPGWMISKAKTKLPKE